MSLSSKPPSDDYEVGYGRPPLGHRFQPGTSGNPKGRPTKKMKASDPAALDKFRCAIIEELTRVMPLEGGGGMPRFLHILLRSAEEASKKGGKPAEFVFRELKEALTLYHREVTERIKVAVEYKCGLQERFDMCRRYNRPPPDLVPHPDHVIITDDGFRIIGPMDRETRRLWEAFKYSLRELVAEIDSTKAKLREEPENVEQQLRLDTLNRRRRRWMRLVPKGWNWRERLWTRDGDYKSIEWLYDQLRAQSRINMSSELRTEVRAHVPEELWTEFGI